MSRLGLAIYAGGNHSFYIAGVLKYLRENGLVFDVVSTYSASSGVYPYFISDRYEKGMEQFLKCFGDNRKNIDLGGLFKGRYIFPHDAIYECMVRNAVKEYVYIEDKGVHVEARIILSSFKSNSLLYRIVGLFSFLALMLYSKTKRTRGNYYLDLFKKVFGVCNEVFVVKPGEAPNLDDLHFNIMGSSTLYPFIKIRKYADKYMLDGKFSSENPITLLEDCDWVLSIHGHYSHVPDRENHIMLLPDRKLKYSVTDYSSNEPMVKLFEFGYKDGARLIDKLHGTPFLHRLA
ncbi:MAG: hypothetical protein ABW168_29850 [Sedimenticola sp.]